MSGPRRTPHHWAERGRGGGKVHQAAFDDIGPRLLIGWAEVAPSLLPAIAAIGAQPKEIIRPNTRGTYTNTDVTTKSTVTTMTPDSGGPASEPVDVASDGDLVDRARHDDSRHWAAHQRPISAETLRKNLRISAARSRMLVSIIRAERSTEDNASAGAGQSTSE